MTVTIGWGEIALRLIAAKGISEPPAASVSRLTASILSALQSHKGKDLAAHAQTHPIKWSIV